MKCPNCTLEIPDDAHFCAFCGDPIRRCAPCDLAFGKDVAFCGGCGSGLATKVEPIFERSNAVFQTSPGRPGRSPEEGNPTFMLPAKPEVTDDTLFGYLYDPESPSRRFGLHQGDNTLGAGHNNDIVIERAAISWNHALVICRNAKVFLQDSASTNGTFVNHTRIDRPHQLQNGDSVRFGNVEFHVWLKARFR
ncbi:FHA domain-containing protein [Bradymonas sediminis]|uniref:Uncharacterized protein n=1 Tax=Bradymonas sediminis TaxID=1548548 RepID=A0A2Z4FJG0_9DELT|nr:FHA domain-containing protein [Bradymonas sediminis]AWV89141.1 hypothetical protein DN745_07240 [Bradymonas sediminis]TDP64393.1 zinc ribbon protein [Bradymonas sediminis]